MMDSYMVYKESPNQSMIYRRELGLRSVPDSLFRRTIVDARLCAPCNVDAIPTKSARHAITTSMHIHPKESEFMLCGSSSGGIQVTNLDSTSQDHIAGMCKKMVSSSQWYSDSIEMFITASCDKTVTLWDVNTMKKVDKVPFEENPSRIHWNEHNERNPLVAVGTGTSEVQLIDFRSGAAVQSVRNKKTVSSVRWLPSHLHLLASGDSKGSIQFWDVRSGRGPLASRQLAPCGAGVGAIRFSSDGLWMVALDCSSHRLIVHLYRAADLTFLTSTEIHRGNGTIHPAAMNNFSLMEDGRKLRMAVPTDDNKIAWITFETDPINPSCSVIFLTGHLSPVTGCQYRPDVQKLYSSSQGLLLCWGPPSERDKALLEMERRKKKNPLGRTAIEDDWTDSDNDGD